MSLICNDVIKDIAVVGVIDNKDINMNHDDNSNKSDIYLIKAMQWQCVAHCRPEEGDQDDGHGQGEVKGEQLP